MNVWHDIDKKRIAGDKFLAVIEISKGSKNKYELDKESGLLKLDRVLSTSMIYPENYGFIPKTLGDDGDPLDVVLICQEPILPLSLVEATTLGVLRMNDGGEGDEKIIAVAAKDLQMNYFRDINDLPTHLLDEIANFFESYKALEGKHTVILGYEGRESAQAIIERSLEKYEMEFKKWRESFFLYLKIIKDVIL